MKNANYYSGLYNCPLVFLKKELGTRDLLSSRFIIDEVIQVYPNPADISVTFEHTFDPGEGYSIEVIDLLGNMVYSYNYEESELEVEWDTSSQIQGMYYVFLYCEGVLLDYKLLSILH